MWLVKQIHPSVAKVAADKSPAFLALETAICRWPDRSLPSRFVTGFTMVGDIEYTGIFREVATDETATTGIEALLRHPGLEILAQMYHRVRPSADDVVLLDLTLAEVEAGHAEGPFTEVELDEKFGRGQWRALERFIRRQSCGKLRPMDSGKKPGHNGASRQRETIFSTLPDFIPAAAAMV